LSKEHTSGINDYSSSIHRQFLKLLEDGVNELVDSHIHISDKDLWKDVDVSFKGYPKTPRQLEETKIAVDYAVERQKNVLDNLFKTASKKLETYGIKMEPHEVSDAVVKMMDNLPDYPKTIKQKQIVVNSFIRHQIGSKGGKGKYQLSIKCPEHTIPPSTKPLSTPQEKTWRNYIIFIATGKNVADAVDKLTGKYITCQYGGHNIKFDRSLLIASTPYPTVTARNISKYGVVSSGAMERVPKMPPLAEGETYHTIITNAEKLGYIEHCEIGKDGQRIMSSTLVAPEKSGQHVIFVSLKRVKEEFTVVIPNETIVTYEKLMNVASRYGKFDVKTAILAFIISYGNGSKSLVTGFLKASGYKGFADLNTETVGEALSRYQTNNIIFRAVDPLPIQMKIAPVNPRSSTKIGKPRYDTKTFKFKTLLGEPVYYIGEKTKNLVLSTLSYKTTLQWWNFLSPQEFNTVMKLYTKLRPSPIWVNTVATIGFTTLEDYKNHKPVPKDTLLHLPAISAYLLVKKGLAQYFSCNKNKDEEKRIMEIHNRLEAYFKDRETELRKIYVQMGLGFF